MCEATADSCSTAFTDGWVLRFRLSQEMRSDNGNTFVSKLWAKPQVLGIEVSYTPPYHAASLRHIERMHRDIKAGLKTALYNIGRDHGAKWMDCLPWVMLARRTAIQQDLSTSPAELVLGTHP